MAEQRHLSRAPIKEALFDFRVTLPTDFNVGSFASLRDRLRDAYPVVDEMRRFEAVFEIASGKSSHQTEVGAQLGYRFASQDGRTIAQFRLDGFTLNRLPQYSNWEELCPEALRLWALFVEVAHPERVDRLALRYINRLSLPPQGNLQEHILVQPPMFPGAPKLLSGFLIREARHDPETGYMANIVQALEPSLGADASALLLDIDVYKVGGLGLSSEHLLPVLDGLRRLKNEIFFNAITEQTAQAYA